MGDLFSGELGNVGLPDLHQLYTKFEHLQKTYEQSHYGMVMINRFLKMIGLFCRISSLL